MPILSPNEPRVLLMIDAAILFCSKIPCITIVFSSHSLNVIRSLEKRTNLGKVFANFSADNLLPIQPQHI